MIDKGQPTCSAACTDGLFQLVLAELPAIIWSTDSELRFTCSLGAGLSALNPEHGQVVGRTLYEFFQTDDRSLPAIAAHYRALGGKSVSFWKPARKRDPDRRVIGTHLVCGVSGPRDPSQVSRGR
jgi:hypothetical protein